MHGLQRVLEGGLILDTERFAGLRGSFEAELADHAIQVGSRCQTCCVNS